MTTQQVSNEAGNLGPPRYELTFSITPCYGSLGTTVLGPGTADLVQPWSLELRGEVVYEAGMLSSLCIQVLLSVRKTNEACPPSPRVRHAGKLNSPEEATSARVVN